MSLKISGGFLKNFSLFVFSLFAFAIAGVAFAQSPGPADYIPLVNVPGIPAGASLTVYLSGLYNFLISIVGVLAMGVLIYGGMRYLISAGNPAAMEDAKDAIMSAIYGLILALGSWLIINVVNPDILVLKNPGVGLPSGAYSYTDSSNSCVTSPLGDGIVANPCKCIDDPDKDIIASETAKITLTSPVSGASAAVGTLINLTGKLTDASSSPVSGKEIRVYVINDKVGIDGIKYTYTTTNATGDFSISSLLPTQCADAVKLQAVFPANDPYSTSTFIASDVVNFTATGAPACAAADYPLHPAKTFISGKPVCQDVCSIPDWASDGKYHCLKADLRVGTTFKPIGKEVTVKVNEAVYFDARTYSADYNYPNLKTNVPSDGPGFDNGVDRYEIDYNTPWLGWFSDYAKSETTNCNLILGVLGFLGNALYDATYTGGMTSTSYAAAGKYEGWVRIYSKGCQGPVIDKVQINVNP